MPNSVLRSGSQRKLRSQRAYFYKVNDDKTPFSTKMSRCMRIGFIMIEMKK